MRKILIVSSAIAIFGICLLFYLAKTSKPNFVPLNEIDSTYIGKTISTSGRIVSVSYNKGNIFLTIYDKNSSINVPIFSNIAKYLDVNLKKGQKIVVSGMVDEYKGKLQIIPRKASDIRVVE
jgi:DNA/RNA endonuclease YhcR with UshA esterase domain